MIPKINLTLIGIIGKMGSGKTTISNYLIKTHGFVKISFADPLKKMLIDTGILSINDLFPTKTPYARKMLQTIGTDIIRNKVDQDYWVKKFKEKVIEACHMCKPVVDNIVSNVKIVVDDIRFPNEFYCVTNELNGKIIKVVRDINNCYKDSLESFHLHESERYVNMFSYDHLIMNNGNDLNNLYNIVDVIIYDILKEEGKKNSNELFFLPNHPKDQLLGPKSIK